MTNIGKTETSSQFPEIDDRKIFIRNNIVEKCNVGLIFTPT